MHQMLLFLVAQKNLFVLVLVEEKTSTKTTL